MLPIPKINKNSETLLILAAVIVVVYLMYKAGHFIGEGIESVKDVFGSGETAKKANARINALEETPDTQNPFSPEYTKALISRGVVVHLIPTNTKKAMAKKIDKAAGSFSGGLITGAISGAKPADLLDVFKQLKYKTQVSDLAGYFQAAYGKNMLTYMTDGLREHQPMTQAANNELITKIIDRVNSLA